MGYAQSHIKAFRKPGLNDHRTTLRMEKDRWIAFKKQCKEFGLTTCFVMRNLIENWLKKTYSEPKIFLRARAAVEIKGGSWVYDKDTMSIWKIDQKACYAALSYNKYAKSLHKRMPYMQKKD